MSELRPLFGNVYAALKRVAESHPVTVSEPAVPVEASVTPDHIVCLEDGRKFKSLKRHLRAMYNMSPEQYRAKWNLPADYPMVAPNYAKTRSELAKAIGLGRTDALRDAA
ncbi:putative transcriptional regulator [Methylobacterium brachiatum]|uniref:Transcriptional regulator n=1 Tax=Methylobacterium brachiatum TaxID=269660 RepID=A0AAJ1TWB9_9HYPH|nr:putative transcriptional regulator [Methylobacterium brachiatum]